MADVSKDGNVGGEWVRPSVYVVVIAAIWFLYIVGYAAFSYAAYDTGLGIFNTVVQTGLDLTASIAAARFSRIHLGWYRLAFALVAVTSLGMALTNLFWGVLFNILGDTSPEGYADLSFRIPFLISVLCWLAFWCLLLFRESSRNISAQGLAVIAAIAAIAVAVFVATYIPLLTVATPDYVHVFVLVYASLELVALIICICATILKTHDYPTFLAAGFILFVATDFLFNTSELTGSLAPNEWAEIPWVLAEACVAVGVFAFHQTALGSAAESPGSSRERDMYAHNMMSIVLFAGLFAAAVLSVFIFASALEIRVFGMLVIVGFVAIAANRFSLLYDEAVRSALGGDILLADPRAAPPHQGLLRAFGSYRAISAVRHKLQDVMTSAIRIDNGFTFRTSDTWKPAKARSMFIIMPYRKDWSNDVYDALCQGAAAAGWSVNRADHRFSQQDLLLNIWVEMCRSELVIADITAHPPNVLYEIGIAHAVGKPVILLRQKGETIPFDLSVQRTITYQPSEPGWMAALGQTICRVLAALDAERVDGTIPAATPSDPVAPETQARF